MFDWVLNTPLIVFLKNLTEFPRKYPWQRFFGSFFKARHSIDLLGIDASRFSFGDRCFWDFISTALIDFS